MYFVKKTDFAILKLDIDDLNTDKLKAVPVNIYKLSNVVEKKNAKKTCIWQIG